MSVKPNKPTTKESLIDAAILVFSANPSASLSEVAEEAGVKRITLHRQIGSRDELLKEIAACSLEEMDKAATAAVKGEKSAIGMLRAIVRSLVPVADRCHFLWKHPSIWENPKLSNETQRQEDELLKLVNYAKQEGSISADIPNAWILASLDAVVYAALTTARSGDIAVNDAADLAVRTFFQGIETSSRPPKK